ncbi:hypothetical protein VTN02DRAFT_2817 [Thermoascus thermophilus]
MLCETKGAAGALEITGKAVIRRRSLLGGRRGRPAGANGVRVAEAGPAMAPSHPRPSTDLSGRSCGVPSGSVRLHELRQAWTTTARVYERPEQADPMFRDFVLLWPAAHRPWISDRSGCVGRGTEDVVARMARLSDLLRSE